LVAFLWVVGLTHHVFGNLLKLDDLLIDFID